MLPVLRIVASIAMLSLAVPGLAQVNADRAVGNYRDLNAGRKQLSDLTPFERAEVAEVDRIVRSRQLDERSSVQRCRDEEIRASDGKASELERRIIEMKCR